MSDETSPLKRMMATVPQVGEVTWIGLSPGRREPITVVDSAVVKVDTGLDGDRHARHGYGTRQVTLIQHEHIASIASMAGLGAVSPEELRRNLVVRGVNLMALKGRRFYVGEVLLEYTGSCDPCSRMEEAFGPGGFNAMRGLGGITASVIEPGTVRVGDSVAVAE